MIVARRVGRVAIIVFIVLAPVAAGAVGQYLGHHDRQTTEPASFPMWTDQECRFNSGSAVGTFRSTYHLTALTG